MSDAQCFAASSFVQVLPSVNTEETRNMLYANVKFKNEKTLFNIKKAYLTMFEKPMVAGQFELYPYARLERVLILKMGQIIRTVDWAYKFQLKSNLNGPLNKAGRLLDHR
jgi:hypothetical protein